jgi:hypothetical protein
LVEREKRASICKREWLVVCGFSEEEPLKSIGLLALASCLTSGIVAAASVGFLTGPFYSTPYATPVVERPAAGDAGTFDGLLNLAEALPPSSIVKVLWTHGMCTHPPSWIDDRVKRLEEAVGGTAETVSLRPVGRRGASLRTDRISVGGRTIEVKFLTWSPLTAPYKAALAYDSSTIDREGGPFARATLNRELKHGLINDCLTDVVVYGGPNGNDIRQAMNETVCEALGGHFDGTRCDVSEGDSPAALAIVTESLASKLVFDAVLNIWNASQDNPDKTAIKHLVNSLAAMRVMYMLANQVPLLDAAGWVAPEGPLPASAPAKIQTSAGDVFGLLSRARRLAPPAAGPTTVVAFSDPNDLLSYRIVPQQLAEHFEELRVINVLVSNDSTYLGYIERPDTAHCGYPWNPHVFGMLARGYQAGKSLHSAPGLSTGACPAFIQPDGPDTQR